LFSLTWWEVDKGVYQEQDVSSELQVFLSAQHLHDLLEAKSFVFDLLKIVARLYNFPTNNSKLALLLTYHMLLRGDSDLDDVVVTISRISSDTRHDFRNLPAHSLVV